MSYLLLIFYNYFNELTNTKLVDFFVLKYNTRKLKSLTTWFLLRKENSIIEVDSKDQIIIEKNNWWIDWEIFGHKKKGEY